MLSSHPSEEHSAQPAGQKRQCDTGALHAFFHLRGKKSLHSAAAPRVRYTQLHESTRSRSRTCKAPYQSIVSQGKKAPLSTRTLWFSVATPAAAKLRGRAASSIVSLAAVCRPSQRHGRFSVIERQSWPSDSRESGVSPSLQPTLSHLHNGALEDKSANSRQACAFPGNQQLRFAPLPVTSLMRKRREELWAPPPPEYRKRLRLKAGHQSARVQRSAA